MGKTSKATTTLRVSPSLLARAEALREPLEVMPIAAALAPLARADVIRLALARGLDELERELGLSSAPMPPGE